eukprot:CAMPEP_0177612888 /NCGR_PEP_ID=MMETSP0419_2-20121207/21570_1 /TAXON_ID=582737 /ORGANISM="Tetraselmis sp., Strain GSL018" /LENGTH=85 /DNA_ID=CAMNT_0019109325 /DNA_START=155 /DNA_END=409 /DNA_ORIENTATION=+
MSVWKLVENSEFLGAVGLSDALQVVCQRVGVARYVHDVVKVFDYLHGLIVEAGGGDRREVIALAQVLVPKTSELAALLPRLGEFL